MLARGPQDVTKFTMKNPPMSSKFKLPCLIVLRDCVFPPLNRLYSGLSQIHVEADANFTTALLVKTDNLLFNQNWMQTLCWITIEWGL